MNLAGKAAVVTGAASGIGQALAIEASKRGARVVAADLKPADETINAIRATGGEAEAFVCDVADPASVTELVELSEQRFGTIHLVAANAGVGRRGSLEECTPDEFAFVMGVNLFGTFYTVRSFAPLLRRAAIETGSASVLITGSEHSLGIPLNQSTAAYTISKHALFGLAEMARSSFAGSGVSATLLCPGWTLAPPVVAYIESDPESTRAIQAVAQTTEAVAGFAWNAVEAGRFLAPTNPSSRELAVVRIQEVSRAFDVLSEIAADSAAG